MTSRVGFLNNVFSSDFSRKFENVKNWPLIAKVALVAGTVLSGSFVVGGSVVLGGIVAASAFSAVLFDPFKKEQTQISVNFEDIRRAAGNNGCITYEEAIEGAIHEVFPGLYLGGAYSGCKPSGVYSYSKESKDSEEFDYVVSVTRIVPFGMNDKKYFMLPYRKKHDIGLYSFESKEQYWLHRAIKKIHKKLKAGEKVFVHCQRGVNRSASLIIAYLMSLYHEITADEALNYIQTRRHIAGPRPEFMEFLRNDFKRVDL